MLNECLINIITGLRINSSRTALYQELGWDTLACRRKIHKLTLFYKIVHGIAPQYLQDLLLPNISPQHLYTLRNSENLKFILPQVKTTSYMNSFLPSTFFFQCPEFADHRTNRISGIGDMRLSAPVSLNLLSHG